MRFLTAAVITGNTTPGKDGYYETVYALTPKDASQSETLAQENSAGTLPAGPLVAFAPIIIFFALFIGAFGIQVIQRSFSVKRAISALVIALFVASTPLVLGAVRDGTRFQSRAGPETIPRQVREVWNDTELTVTWFTDTETVGAVRIGQPPLRPDTLKVYIADNGKKTREHKVTISKLASGTLYELEILSNSDWYDNRGEPLRITIP